MIILVLLFTPELICARPFAGNVQLHFQRGYVMKPHTIIFDTESDTRTLTDERNAYHQAGHAAAIYFGNKQKQLPELRFQIIIKPLSHNEQNSNRFSCHDLKMKACVEGGRLIQNLPLSYTEATQYFSWPQQEEYICSFETDVINLLSGSIAEAKFLASCDAEAFSPHLVNLSALHFYGGSAEVEIINEYMECFLVHQIERERKLAQLFTAAFNLVNEKKNWLIIEALAEYILDKSKAILHCEEITALLDSCMASS